MSDRFPLLLVTLLVLLVAGCSGAPDTGPGEVRWDRDACQHCRMVLSDHNHAAEIRYYPPDKKRSKLFKFDDIGCAVVWLNDKPWKDDPKTQIWVLDRTGGGWLNARTATYVTGDVTPMEYGLGAVPDPVPGGLNFAQAKQHIFEVEKQYNLHGVDLLKRLQQRQRGAASGHAPAHNHDTGETQQ